jgi:hypothetical protein
MAARRAANSAHWLTALEGRGFRSARDTERAAQMLLGELRYPSSG